MKILLTGHHGYIGSVCWPILAAAGHEVVGLDTLFYRGCDLSRAPRASPELALDVRDVRPRTSRASTRSSTSQRSRTTRSATSAQSSPARSTTRRPCRWLAPPVTRAYADSSSRRPAACTSLRKRGRRRERSAEAAQRVRRVEGSRRGGGRAARGLRLRSRSRCATPPPTASLRACASTSSSTTSSAGRTRPAR